jgi:hypothetical protein
VTVRWKLVVACAAVAACTRSTYLGAPLPRSCEQSFGACDYDLQFRGWADQYPSARPALVAYVTGVAGRIARASELQRVPPIVIIAGPSAAVFGNKIVIGREAIMRLGTEAELAAILAHEIAHLEGHLTDLNGDVVISDEEMRALEGAADERAALLLERAGYPPSALPRALRRLPSDTMDDTRHPPLAVRLRRLALITAARAAGDEGRGRFLAAIAGESLVSEPGSLVGEIFVYPAAGVAVTLPANVTRYQNTASLGGYDEAHGNYYRTVRIGPRTAADLVEHLRDRRTMHTAVGEISVGRAPRVAPDELSSRDRLVDKARRSLSGLEARSAVAVLRRPTEAVLLVVEGLGAVRAVELWARTLRAPTGAERAAAIVPRLVLVSAPRAGTVEELVTACLDPAAARELDDPARVLASGDPIKCTDRRVP